MHCGLSGFPKRRRGTSPSSQSAHRFASKEASQGIVRTLDREEGILFVGRQISQELMNQTIDIALGQCEGVGVHGLLADGPVDQVLCRVLDEIKDNGSLLEANVFVANRRRPPAPRLPAAKGSANHSPP